MKKDVNLGGGVLYFSVYTVSYKISSFVHCNLFLSTFPLSTDYLANNQF